MKRKYIDAWFLWVFDLFTAKLAATIQSTWHMISIDGKQNVLIVKLIELYLPNIR